MTKKADHIILTCQQLTVGYSSGQKTLPIIKNIDLSVESGQLICFMGPNGAGKSTLLRTICGLQPPLSGQVKLEGQAIIELSRQSIAKQISLVLTDRIGTGNISAYEMIAMGRYPYLGWNLKTNEEDENFIERSIELTGVTPFLSKKIGELSDGQLQKVMIARALAQNTPIMILDEPTAHLDLNNRVAIVNLLKRLAHNENKTIIMATHELDLALQTADHLWLISSDGTMHHGFPEDLILNGLIDQVFQLKGFDLKTGVLEKDSKGFEVGLVGTGHLYLWTKNALERMGFTINDQATQTVICPENEEFMQWQIQNTDLTFNTLEKLLDFLLSEGD